MSVRRQFVEKVLSLMMTKRQLEAFATRVAKVDRPYLLSRQELIDTCVKADGMELRVLIVDEIVRELQLEDGRKIDDGGFVAETFQ